MLSYALIVTKKWFTKRSRKIRGLGVVTIVRFTSKTDGGMKVSEEKPYIDFNMNLIDELKERYENNLVFIAEGLPCGVNFNSPKQIREVLGKRLDITAENVKIEALERYRDLYDHDSEAFDFMNGLVLFLKTKYTLNNYINCILKHNENGRVYLRHERGEWLLPNKRPLTESPEIRECITASHIPKRRRTNYGRN